MRRSQIVGDKVIRRFTGCALFVPADVVDNHSQGDLDSFTPVRSTWCFSFTLQAAVSNAVPDLVVVMAVLVLDEFEESAGLPAKAGFGWWRPSARPAC